MLVVRLQPHETKRVTLPVGYGLVCFENSVRIERKGNCVFLLRNKGNRAVVLEVCPTLIG